MRDPGSILLPRLSADVHRAVEDQGRALAEPGDQRAETGTQLDLASRHIRLDISSTVSWPMFLRLF
jgi:hypothetical protein